MTARIVLAYSGDLDASVAIGRLAETFTAEVVTVTLDLGAGRNLDDVRDRALSWGAVRAHVLDVREEFAREYLLRALRGGAFAPGQSPAASAIARPAIAQKLVEVAQLEGATAIAHGCTPGGFGAIRFEAATRALNPVIPVIAFAQLWAGLPEDAKAYAQRKGLPVPAANRHRGDANLWGRSIALDGTPHLGAGLSDDCFETTTAPSVAPDVPANLQITVERGVPVAVNGVTMGFVELIESVTTIAGGHGVGRLDVVESDSAGAPVRAVHEAPAAVVLGAVHHALEALVWAPEAVRANEALGVRYAELVHDGRWFTPRREALDEVAATNQEHVSGVIQVRLHKGTYEVVGRVAPRTGPVVADETTVVSDPEGTRRLTSVAAQ